MSSSISGIELFDYRGRYYKAQNLDVSKPLTTAKTDYTTSFTWNAPVGSNSSNLLQPPLGINERGYLNRVEQQSAESLLSFGADSLKLKSNLTTDAVTARYKDFVDSLSVSEGNYNQLMKQDSFTIPNGRAGIKVETDGEGNIARVSIEPGSKDLRSGTPQNLVFPDRAEITQRAESRRANELPLPDFTPFNNLAENRQIFLQDSSTASLEKSQTLNKAPGIAESDIAKTAFKNRADISPSQRLDMADTSMNPVLKRLLQLQPRDVGMPVFGPDSQVSPQMAKQIAAVNGSFGVNQSNILQENLGLLRARLAQESISPQSVVHAREGLMPANPSPPSGDSALPQQKTLFGQGGFLEQLTTFVDTTEKKSSGGSYMPFNGGKGEDRDRNSKRRPVSAVPLYLLA